MVKFLNPAEGNEVYDPACGSGGMLVEAHYHLKQKDKDPRRLSLFGQEINVFTWAVAKMNVLLHAMEAKIHQGDTFSNPKFLGSDGNLDKFDIVLANPMWNQDGYKPAMESDRFDRFIYGIAPNSSADWGWIQHMLASLKPGGRMGIVLDNGVLFRGGAEGKIRKKIVEKDLVESVISLPEKLFYNTGAPGCILILNKYKSIERKDKILFIYAANNFEKLKAMNRLRDEDIGKISKTYHEFKPVDKYAKIVPIQDVEENEYNLSVTRYVDVFSEDEVVEIKEVLQELKTIEAIRTEVEQKLSNYLKELGYGQF